MVRHEGVVDRVEELSVWVKILCESACSSCHAKGACGAMDSSEREIEVVSEMALQFSIGEKVEVSLQESMGLMALFWGYLLPFLLVLFSLAILIAVELNESAAGLISLILLAPYYLGLYLNRDRLKKVFSFTIRKL